MRVLLFIIILINLTWPNPVSRGHLGLHLYAAVLEVEAPGTPEPGRLDRVDHLTTSALSLTTVEQVTGAHVTRGGTCRCEQVCYMKSNLCHRFVSGSHSFFIGNHRFGCDIYVFFSSLYCFGILDT